MAKLSKDNRTALDKAQVLIDEAATLVREVRDELQGEYHEKSERWQEGDAGTEMQERIDALEAADSSLEDAMSSVGSALGGGE